MPFLYKEYVEYNDKTIKMVINFNKETRSWFSGKPKKIGYEVTVVPVKITKLESGLQMEESGALTGFNDCLLEVGRQSSKRLDQAILILAQRKAQYLNYFDNE